MIEIAGWHGKPVHRVLVGVDGEEPKYHQGIGCGSKKGDTGLNVDGLSSVSEDGAFAKNLKLVFE
jgi:hypothetical protein